jgi:hypothetical protein
MSLLHELDAAPQRSETGEISNRAAVVHLITPGAEFLDKGKTALVVPQEVADQIARAIALTGKTLYTEKKRRERNANRASRPVRSERTTLVDACFEVIPQAYDKASGNGQYEISAHTLFYQVRPLVEEVTGEVLQSHYFEQDVLVQWEAEHGQITYRDARGSFREPHTGTVVPLGTREVAEYEPPEYVYDAALYVEKEGMDPVLKSARLAERFDLGIASGKGQPTVAVRDLFTLLKRLGIHKLFTEHDADLWGYIIRQAMKDATKRMPEHHLEIIDLGLTVTDAIRMRLPSETYYRKAAVPRDILPLLSNVEKEWFVGEFSHYDNKGKRVYKCKRVELNAMTVPQFVRFNERQLRANGVGKIMPPDNVIEAAGRDAYRRSLVAWIYEQVAELLDIEAIGDRLVTERVDRIVVNPARWIKRGYRNDRGTYWRSAIDSGVEKAITAQETALTQRLKQELGLAEQ